MQLRKLIWIRGLALKNNLNRINPKNRKRLNLFVKHVGRGINRFSMIGNNDGILIGVSGGKDSLALSMALKLREKRVPIHYRLYAVQIEWKEFPFTEEEKESIGLFFRELDIPFYRVKAHVFPPSFKHEFNCYLCSRNRKRILFDEAVKLGIKKVALGHHLDDIIETTLLNIFFRGEVSTMMPVMSFFGGKMEIIRPMCEVHEREISRVADIAGLPVVPIRCPKKGITLRNNIKEIIKQVSHLNKNVKENIYRAPWHIKKEYLPFTLEGPNKLE